MKSRVYKRRRYRYRSRRKLNAMMRGVRWHRRQRWLVERAASSVRPDDPNNNPIA
jgi:hypothetical protein